MTKAQMVKVIKESEDKLWNAFNMAQTTFGEDSEEASKLLERWATIFELQLKLGL